MLTVKEMMKPIDAEMSEFEVRFRQSMKSKVPLLDKITHYIIRRKGKQMRPMFIFLTAKMLGEMNDRAYDAASLVELLHTLYALQGPFAVYRKEQCEAPGNRCPSRSRNE